MKPKNFARLEREINLMRLLGGGDGLVDLFATFEDTAHKYLVSSVDVWLPCLPVGCLDCLHYLQGCLAVHKSLMSV